MTFPSRQRLVLVVCFTLDKAKKHDDVAAMGMLLFVNTVNNLATTEVVFVFLQFCGTHTYETFMVSDGMARKANDCIVCVAIGTRSC